MRRRLLSIALPLVFCAATAAEAQVSFGIATPTVSIGVNLPTFPTLVRVPGYPVYYDPQVNANYFFYDGLFWVFSGDTWYSSAWYDGPWEPVAPEYVPAFVLRIPVRYYREPPVFFRGWRADAPPRWGEHWGHDWEVHHAGWDHWNHNAVPAPAPLPVYQRQYSGDRYPHAPEQQQALRARNYHYQPHENVSRQVFARQATPAPARAQANPAPTRTAQPRETTPPRTATAPAASHPPARNAEARSATPTAEVHSPTRNAQARPEPPAAGAHPPTRNAQARPAEPDREARPPTQTAHAAPAQRPQAAPARPAPAPQVARQSQHAPAPQARGEPEARPPERAAQRAPEGRAPTRQAQAPHAAPQGKPTPSEARGGGNNGSKEAAHDDKGRPQQQGNAGQKDERRGG
jgi:hypothetical protein